MKEYSSDSTVSKERTDLLYAQLLEEEEQTR